MYEILIEHSVEHDLRKVVKKDFNHIISAMKVMRIRHRREVYR
jgi:hypothetical protein